MQHHCNVRFRSHSSGPLEHNSTMSHQTVSIKRQVHAHVGLGTQVSPVIAQHSSFLVSMPRFPFCKMQHRRE